MVAGGVGVDGEPPRTAHHFGSLSVTTRSTWKCNSRSCGSENLWEPPKVYFRILTWFSSLLSEGLAHMDFVSTFLYVYFTFLIKASLCTPDWTSICFVAQAEFKLMPLPHTILNKTQTDFFHSLIFFFSKVYLH
jgi:hypothetical protein